MTLFRALELAAEEWALDEDSRPPLSSLMLPRGMESIHMRAPLTQKWSRDEDRLLLAVALRFQPDWKKIADFFPGRPKSVVKRRWENQLDPSIDRTPWSDAEDFKILFLLSTYGPIWKKIAQYMPGRPADVIKNRYYGHIKRFHKHTMNSDDKAQYARKLQEKLESLEKEMDGIKVKLRELEQQARGSN